MSKKIADETKVSVDSLVTSTTFDPGASSATESQLVNDLERNSIAPERSTAPGMASTAQVQSSDDEDTHKENEDTPSATANPRKKPSYGKGVNPKLAQTQESSTAREQAE